MPEYVKWIAFFLSLTAYASIGSESFLSDWILFTAISALIISFAFLIEWRKESHPYRIPLYLRIWWWIEDRFKKR